MAMTPERSKPLHNFSLPCLKWGSQRFLRCVKVTSHGQTLPVDRRSSGSEPRPQTPLRQTKPNDPGSSRTPEPTKSSPSRPINRPATHRDKDNKQIETIREKLMFDLRVAANKIRVSILEEGVEEESGSARPWNLRTRRAACRAPSEEKKGELSPLRRENLAVKPSRVRGEKNERTKFSIALSREEVEDDFAAMAGIRPPRRPKKRARIVQKQLDSVFPGLWLTEITEDSYKVPELPESGKG